MGAVAKTSRARDGQNVATVHERLRTAILRGEIEAGATIPQALLASDLGAGRTPLREALRMLQREGLVISEPNRKVRIATLSGEDAEELFIMRIALEAVAIRITVPTLTSDDLAELEGYIAQMDHYQRVDDQAGFRTPHRAFHHLLIAASGPRVSTEIAELVDHSERYRLRFGNFGSWNERRTEHRGILDAATAHDPDLAADRLAAHHAQTAALVFGVLEPERDLGRLRTTIRTVAPGAEAALRTG
jgi:GntR family transcriptional regulator, rspAB operon transcriptional repressor